MAQANANQPDPYPSVIELLEERKGLLDEKFIVGGIGDTGLFAEGIEVGIAQLDADAGRELVFLSKPKAQLFHHLDEEAPELLEVYGVLAEGSFGGNGFSL